ncbi:MAG: DNA polymerase III subunit gamma/tau [Anaerolineae bacterium]|nr:DNA polymerase III subunit gamma/tau [Anaerolineae bacterium]
MAAQALYRRWRPQTFEDVVGQSHILQTLRNALATGRVAHAYLFAGPRGTGKTTIARILARAVNCTAAPERRPCGECAVCRSLAEGRSLDLIEIDAASHTGVDNVRDLIEKVQFAPSEAQYKVYIIDEVHMLSTPAFNALLKTLEEPPPHALFFLATTEAHKIPATILSRCQRFSFQRIPLSDMVAHLTHICATEGFEAEPAAIELIGRYAQGGLRDAISLLDQMVAFGGENITLAQVQSVLGTAADAAVEVLAEHLVLGDTAGGLRLINQAVDAGVDGRQLVNQLLEYLRSLMLIQNGSGGLLNVTAETQSRLETQARRIAPAALVRAIKLFTEAAQSQRSALQMQLPLELALVEATLDLSRTPQASGDGAPGPAHRAAPSAHPAPAIPSRPVETPAAPPPLSPSRSEAAAEVAPPPRSEATTVEGPVLDLVSQWEAFLAAVNQQDKRVGGLLKDCYPLEATVNQVTLGVYYSFHQKQLEDTKRRGLLEDVLSRTLGSPVRVQFKLTPKTKAEMDAERPKNPLQEATDDPVVKEAVRMGGKITGISLDT